MCSLLVPRSEPQTLGPKQPQTDIKPLPQPLLKFLPIETEDTFMPTVVRIDCFVIYQAPGTTAMLNLASIESTYSRSIPIVAPSALSRNYTTSAQCLSTCSAKQHTINISRTQNKRHFQAPRLAHSFDCSDMSDHPNHQSPLPPKKLPASTTRNPTAERRETPNVSHTKI